MKWTRRRLLQAAGATGALNTCTGTAAWAFKALQETLPPPRSQASSPEIINGGRVPLLEGNLDRPLRYSPCGSGFSVLNGKEFFNRPLYGPNIPFRVDGGDLPEFSLYLPGHGGNLRLGFANPSTGRSIWAFSCQSITTHATEGRLQYELQDLAFGSEGRISIEAFTHGAALWVQVTGSALPPNLQLLWAFGGVSGRKGRRNGDIGCEEEPVSRFFQVRPAECSANVWTLPKSSVQGSSVAFVENGSIRLRTLWSAPSELRIGDAASWDKTWQDLWASASHPTDLPVLVGRSSIGSSPLHLSVGVMADAPSPQAAMPAVPDPQDFASRRAELATVSQGVRWQTPDLFLNSMAGALNIAADAIWDEAQGCVMHGAVAWRLALAGWRGPYALDALGAHDRMRRHLRHWLSRQDDSPVTNGSGGHPSPSGFVGIEEARGTPDPGSHGARTENLLHSSGDLGHNHYDMNLVFFDAMLRHLRWTGDLAFAREAWPALERHAAWERRLFRRDYGTAAEPLPLYEAYAAIWASDNLQYNGGGATHSSAYNVFLNRGMAELATRLGMDPTISMAHRAEADAISKAMRQLLWMPNRGAFAEGRDWLAERRLLESPAIWTVYHTIDCEVTTELEAWQMAAERLQALRKVPIRGAGLPPDAGWQLACSDWHPYVWSLTLLVTAENFATALSLFQAGMADEGYGLLRGTLIDAGFRGLCPGNFPMSLQLDPHRQESQRDFADPIGCATRAIIEGLWGVRPDLLNAKLQLRPQLPLDWHIAELNHPNLSVTFQREHDRDRWRIQSTFNQPVQLTLQLRARSTSLPQVRVEGMPSSAFFVHGAVGEPRLHIDLPQPGKSWIIDILWSGTELHRALPLRLVCSVGESILWPPGVQTTHIHDPQACLRHNIAHSPGGHTVFALQKSAHCEYWLPIELQIGQAARDLVRTPSSPGSYEAVTLGSLLTGRVREVFSRSVDSPRSGLCSLNLPSGLLGGWANFDVQYSLDDSGLRAAGGRVPISNGLYFLTPSGPTAPNCRFISHWQVDSPTLKVPLQGRAQAVHLLLLGTTFPQATRTPHASVRLTYADGTHAGDIPLRSPNDWWPVEQDYEVDDYLFRFDQSTHPAVSTSWRVDLRTGLARSTAELRRPGTRGNIVPGGSAFVLRVDADPFKDLQCIELHCLLYGIVAGLLGVTLERV